jgi:hypothetical protein
MDTDRFEKIESFVVGFLKKSSTYIIQSRTKEDFSDDQKVKFIFFIVSYYIHL